MKSYTESSRSLLSLQQRMAVHFHMRSVISLIGKDFDTMNYQFPRIDNISRWIIQIRCFCYDTIDEIIAALDHQKPSTFVRETKQKLLSASPTSLRVTLKALRKAETMTLCECLAMEFDLIQKFMVIERTGMYKGKGAVF